MRSFGEVPLGGNQRGFSRTQVLAELQILILELDEEVHTGLSTVLEKVYLDEVLNRFQEHAVHLAELRPGECSVK